MKSLKRRDINLFVYNAMVLMPNCARKQKKENEKLTRLGHSVPQSPPAFRMAPVIRSKVAIVVVHSTIVCQMPVPIQMVGQRSVPAHDIADDGAADGGLRLTLGVAIAEVAAGAGAAPLQALGGVLADVGAHRSAGPQRGPAARIAAVSWALLLAWLDPLICNQV